MADDFLDAQSAAEDAAETNAAAVAPALDGASALWWSGKPDRARAQFATASRLDLTPYEKSQLARMEAMHG